MVSSIFCDHNKQTAVQEDVLLPPSCAWGEEKMLPRTSAPRREGELRSRDSTAVSKKSVRGLELHPSDQWICRCLPPLAQLGSNMRPRLGLSQLHLSARQAWHNSRATTWGSCFTGWKIHVETGRRDWPRKPSAQLTTPQHPAFLSQRLFASLLLTPVHFINSIESCTGLFLTHTICFPARLTPKISSLQK